MAEALKVLIVDEDPDGRVAARKALQRGGLAIAGETGFGTQAVSLAVAARPDVILLSVEEPVMRSLETAEVIANALPDTPIIMISSTTDAESVRRGMVFGARDYLLKPLQAAPLRAAILRSLEQEERRQMRRAGQLTGETGFGTVITVTGAKGGIGKSVACVNLAVALRLETGKSVAVIDADTQFGDIATLLDLTPVTTVADVLRDPAKFDRATAAGYMTRHSTGVDVLATPRDDDPWSTCTPETWRQLVDVLAQLYEFVLVDTAGSFDQFARGCIERASLTLLVTTGEVSSLRDTGWGIKRLAAWGIDMDRVRLVFNRGARASGVGKQEIEKALAVPVFWELPDDKAVPQSVQVGQPVAMDPRNAALGKNVRALARLIAGTKKSLVAQPSTPSSWRRFISFRGRSNDANVAAVEPDPQR
ncbi:MAG: response regulator [Chloroflexi bacterium]|nr:response regulator [Chloroflexota bacterium]